MVKLLVRKILFAEDIHKDIIRVHEDWRKDVEGRPIKDGQIVLLKLGGEELLVCARGTRHREEGPQIFMEEILRDKLGVKVKQEYEFEFIKSRFWKDWWCSIKWAWFASDPGYRIAMRIAVVLGILSVVLGAVSVVLSLLLSSCPSSLPHGSLRIIR